MYLYILISLSLSCSVYGDDYKGLGLSSDTVASSFGTAPALSFALALALSLDTCIYILL